MVAPLRLPSSGGRPSSVAVRVIDGDYMEDAGVRRVEDARLLASREAAAGAEDKAAGVNFRPARVRKN